MIELRIDNVARSATKKEKAPPFCPLTDPPVNCKNEVRSKNYVGKTSRTDNFRNARCRQAIESTTNRVKSLTNCSSDRQFATKTAKSDAIAMRCLTSADWNFTLREFTLFICRASRKCLRGAKLTGQSKMQCHSVSNTFTPLLIQQKRQQRFISDSRNPGRQKEPTLRAGFWPGGSAVA